MGESFAIQDVLLRGISIVKSTWAKEYLLKPTPESDLAILTSKEQAQNAFAGKLQTAYGAGNEQTTSVDASEMNANWVFMPAYSIDGLSAGILLKENSRIGIVSDVGYAHRQYIRFIRKEDTGEVFGVCIDSERPFVDVMIISWSSPEHRHRCFMRFSKHPFLDIMRAEDGVDLAAAATCALYYAHLDEHRVCTLCDPYRLGDICTCRTGLCLKRPRFILDGLTSAQNMLKHTGSFAGKVTRRKLSAGLATMEVTSRVFGGMSGGNEPGLIPRLFTWAISKCIANSVLSPSWLPSSLNTSSSFNQHAPPQLNFGSVSTGEFDGLVESDWNIAEDVPLSLEPVVIDNESSNPGSFNSLGNVPPSSPNLSANVTSSSLASCGRVSPEPIASHFEQISVRQSLVSVPQALTPGNGFHVGSGNHAQRSILPQGSVVVPVLPSGPTVPIEPVGIRATPLYAGVSSKLPPMPLDKETRMLQQKIRNRESAARSNMKKQLRRKQLQEDLSVEVGKVEKLRQRLKILREENEELRQKCSFL